LGAGRLSCISRSGMLRNRVTSKTGQAGWPIVAAGRSWERLCQFEAGEQHQIVGHCGPDIGFEVVEPAPGAASGAIDTFEAGDPGLDPAQKLRSRRYTHGLLTISATAMTHFLWKATSATPRALAAVRLAAGIAAIGGGLPRRRAGSSDVAIEHGQKALGVGGIAGLDDDIEDQATLAGGQAELVSY